MSKSSLIGCSEITVTFSLPRISKLKGLDQIDLQSEFRVLIEAIESLDNNNDVLYINKIN